MIALIDFMVTAKLIVLGLRGGFMVALVGVAI